MSGRGVQQTVTVRPGYLPGLEACEGTHYDSGQPVGAGSRKSGKCRSAALVARNTSDRETEGGLLRENHPQGSDRNSLDDQPQFHEMAFVEKGRSALAPELARAVSSEAGAANHRELLDREADPSSRGNWARVGTRSLAQLSGSDLERSGQLAGHGGLRESRQLVRQSWLLQVRTSVRSWLGTQIRAIMPLNEGAKHGTE